MISKTLAIVIVAVVVVAGGASGFMLLSNNNSNDAEKQYGDIDYSSVNLMIFGNANNDLTIDDKDKTVIQEIIDGEKSVKDYPFADVNYDGVVNNDDLTAVQKIINRENGITLHVACYDYGGKKTVAEVTYPFTNIGLYGMSAINSTLCANAGSKVVASANPSGGKDDYPVAMGSLGGEEIGSGMGATADVDWKRFMEIDTQTPISALFMDSAYSSKLDATSIMDMKDAGIPILAFNGNDVYAQISATAFIGFLCGTETEKVGAKFASTSQEILSSISAKVSTIADEDKETFMTFTMWICVCQNDSPNNSLGILAGGMPYYKTNSEFASKYEGNSFSMNLDTETLANFQDCDKYLSIRTTDFKTDATQAALDQFDFENESMGGIPVTTFMHDAKDRLVFVNNLLPAALKVAYIAQILYPDLFDSDFADKLAQRYIDEGYAPFAGLTLADLDAIITYADYKAAGGAN